MVSHHLSRQDRRTAGFVMFCSLSWLIHQLNPQRKGGTNGTLKSTRMRTFSPLRLTSVMDSLEDRDIITVCFGDG